MRAGVVGDEAAVRCGAGGPRWAPARRSALASLLAALALASAACGAAPADLDELVRRDSLYLTPGALTPHTGGVVRYFPGGEGKVQLEGRLMRGTWEGELTVYHESGRLRYQGVMSGGAPCGAWIEDREDLEGGSLHDILKQDIESMGLYPPCPGESLRDR